MHISIGLWSGQKLKAGGESKQEANLEHVIPLLSLAGVRALHPSRASGVEVCLATQREAPYWIHIGLEVGGKKQLELLQSRERVDPGGRTGEVAKGGGCGSRLPKVVTLWFTCTC